MSETTSESVCALAGAGIFVYLGIIAMLVALVGFLCWRMARKNDELRHKNNVIVSEVERNQRLIDRAVSLGLNRAALL